VGLGLEYLQFNHVVFSMSGLGGCTPNLTLSLVSIARTGAVYPRGSYRLGCDRTDVGNGCGCDPNPRPVDRRTRNCDLAGSGLDPHSTATSVPSRTCDPGMDEPDPGAGTTVDSPVVLPSGTMARTPGARGMAGAGMADTSVGALALAETA